jgi:DNA polymerase
MLPKMNQYNLFEPLEKQESLEVLNYHIRACSRCRLAATRKHALPGEGKIDAQIMFIALSPGYKEDLQNRMFVGPSGQVFNKLLQAAKIDKNSVFMTNLVKCILPKNRKPTMDEIESCSYFLNEEISIIHPEVIVPLGYYATRSVLNKYGVNLMDPEMSFGKINGQLLSLDNNKIFPLSHPSALLYNPSMEPDIIMKYKKLKTFI